MLHLQIWGLLKNDEIATKIYKNKENVEKETFGNEKKWYLKSFFYLISWDDYV